MRLWNRHHYRADDGSAETDHDGVLSYLGLKDCRFDVGGEYPRQNLEYLSVRLLHPIQHLQILGLVLLRSWLLLKRIDLNLE